MKSVSGNNITQANFQNSNINLRNSNNPKPQDTSATLRLLQGNSGFNYIRLLRLISLLISLLKGHDGNSGKRIDGTHTDDKLEGTQGNDRIRGFAGDDILNGNDGNDKLYGGKGNDRLNGGAGNDTLVDNQGSNTFNGGAGDDTIRLSGKLSDYEISPLRIPGENPFRLVNRNTGDSQIVFNVENFRFSDKTVTAKDLFKFINPPALQLSKAQDAALRKHFNIPNNFQHQVLDSDRNGKLSAGDVLVLSGGITGGEISRQTLSDADVKAINSSTNNNARAQFEANIKKWQKANIKDYSFTFQRSCFCIRDVTRPVNLDIRNGKVNSASFSDTGKPLTDAASINKVTIDDMFKAIKNGLDNNAETVRVTYDPTYGYPTSIFIDQSRQIADEETSFTIKDFQRNDEPIFTTLALGEEDGGTGGIDIGNPKPVEPPVLTTLALGEEDGGVGGIDIGNPKPVDPPVLTTLALGEEDGGYTK